MKNLLVTSRACVTLVLVTVDLVLVGHLLLLILSLLLGPKLLPAHRAGRVPEQWLDQDEYEKK